MPLLSKQTCSIPNTLLIHNNFGDGILNQESPLKIYNCVLDRNFIVASVFLSTIESKVSEGLFLVFWDKLSGEFLSLTKLTRNPQKYIMYIYKGCVRLFIQNPESLSYPWSKPGEYFSRGKWLLTLKIANGLMAVQHTFLNSDYERCGVLHFCDFGRFLVTGYKYLDIYEDIEFDCGCDESDFKRMIYYQQLYGSTPEIACGNNGVIVMSKSTWSYGESTGSKLSVFARKKIEITSTELTTTEEGEGVKGVGKEGNKEEEKEEGSLKKEEYKLSEYSLMNVGQDSAEGELVKDIGISEN